jgi:hypothetical protein
MHVCFAPLGMVKELACGLGAEIACAAAEDIAVMVCRYGCVLVAGGLEIDACGAERSRWQATTSSRPATNALLAASAHSACCDERLDAFAASWLA